MKRLIALLLFGIAMPALAQLIEDDFVAARLSEYLERPVAVSDIESPSWHFEDGACANFLEDQSQFSEEPFDYDSVWSPNNAVIDVWYYGNLYTLYTHDYNEGAALCAGEQWSETQNPLPPIEDEPPDDAPDECKAVRAAVQAFDDMLIRADLIRCLG